MKFLFLFQILFVAFYCEVEGQKAATKIICNEIITENPEYSDVVSRKTWAFKNHLFKSSGTPDYKGRYSYKYEIFQIKDNDTLKINNSDFFKARKIELEKVINNKLKAKYDANSKIPEISDCMKWIDFRYYKLNEFGISFTDNNQMEFNIDYRIGSACFNVNSSSIGIDLSEIESYIK